MGPTKTMHWTHGHVRPNFPHMKADEIMRYGAYLALAVPPAARSAAAALSVDAFADCLRLQTEFSAAGGDPPESIAFLRRIDAARGAIDDEALASADAIVHAAVASERPVCELCSELSRMFAPLKKSTPQILNKIM